MTSRILRLLWLLGVVAFVSVFVASHRRRIDPIAHDAFSRDLRALFAYDAELNDQVMQSRQALVTHYDHIVQTTAAMRQAFVRLERVPTFLEVEERAAITPLLAAAREHVVDKERAIEDFKSENAVLRNSARYFPTAALQLRDRLETTPGEAATARLVNDLLCSVLRFNQLTGQGQEERARAALAAIAEVRPRSPFGDELAVVARHAEVVLERRDGVDARTKAITAMPTRAALGDLDATYSAAYQSALRASDRRRTALFLLAFGVLALVSADMITHLRRVAKSEREASEKLAAANQALVRDKEREKELSDLKSRFVSMTSHEFRTPLSVILSSTELIEAYGERWSPSKRADHFRRIKAGVRGMTDLLDGILVIGKADMGRLGFAPVAVDLPRFCAEMGETIHPSLKDVHVYESSVDGDFADVWLDEKLLNHILTNLLSNAVKYSPAGGAIRFDTWIEADEVVFRVQDEGIGIAAEDRTRLFESFHRGRNVGDIPGTGLGLAVVKRAVDAHRGRLEVASHEGEGTSFVVRLPLERRPRPTDGVTPGAREQDRLQA